MNSRRDSLTRTTSLTTLDMDLFLFCVVSLLVFLLLGHCSADLNQDASGLLAFKKSVDANDRLDWGSSSNPCEWEGIKCEGPPLLKSLRVVEVRTPGTPLYGSIPSGTLSLLSELRVISLRANHLSGRFPSDLSNCSFLRSMYLQYNYLSGPLPDFSSWPNLVHVDLSFNNFSGSIPSTLGNLTRLVTLYLKNNSLTGSLPLINIDSLNGFSVANNDLEGPVPDTQMYRRFNEDSFVGNGLCGLSLQSCDKKSPGNVQVPQNIVGSHHRGLSKGAIVGIIAALIAVCLCLVFLCLFAFRKGISKDNKSGKPASNGAGPVAHGDPRATYAPALEMNSEYKKLVFLDGVEHSFDLEELLRASAEVLGKGSIGTSYKAALDSGLIVAVKRLRDITTERREFEAHMSNISRIKHEHLLPFIAYFYSREEKLVVTEYMPNGSLSTLLHGNKGTNSTPLAWDTRINIAIDTALGIEFLHEHMCIHGNIKSSNILISRSYSSRISDYGMVELVSASPVPNRILGYRAPEVLNLKMANEKADVYSYGVLLLELLTGKEPVNMKKNGEGFDLPRWVQSAMEDESRAHIFDEELIKYNNSAHAEMMQMLEIARSCVAPSPDQRPTMRQVRERLQVIRAFI